MADDSRRGDSNMADADVKPDGGNSVEITTETVKGDTVKEIPTAVDEVGHSATEATTENLPEGFVKYSRDQDSLSGNKDTEETKKQLARAREELNRAMEESARAKDEVEKAKKDLAEAKQDTPKAVEEKPGVDNTNGNSPEKFEEPSQSSGSAQAEPQAVLSSDNQAVVEGSLSASNNQNDCDKEPSQKITSEDAQMGPESSSDLANTKDGIRSGKDENGVKEAHHSDHELEEDEEDVVSGEEHDEEAEDEGEEDEEGEDEEGDETGEQAAAKPLDDDEDRRNPQYIPKRGGFYEHDDRTREEGEEGTPEQPVVEEKLKKNMRSEAAGRWGHDMYDEIQQGPKSDHELVAVYGYDIRQEEGAPRARRRRRYGRGPNKYDRTWEDEEAYSRPRGRGTSRGGLSRGSDAGRQRSQRQETPKKEDFPPLADQLKESRPSDENTFDRGQNRTEVDSSTGSVERRAGGSKASAISFRRGGGGRTFEERGKPRPPKARSETGDGQPSFQKEPDNTRELSLKESARSVRGRGDITRGMVSRGTGARGGASRGTGASPRGRGSASYRGGRQGSESATWKDEEEPQQTRSASHQHGSGRTFHGHQQNTHADNHRSFEEPRGRGRGKFPRQGESSEQGIAVGVEQMRIDGHSQPQPARHQDATRSKRYSSQRQRMTTPPPAAVPAPMSQPPYPVTGGGNASYYAPYNDSPPPNYVQAAPGPMLPMAVAAQGAPPTYMGPPIYGPTGGPSPFPATPYQGYPAAAGPPPVGVPIGSPTQDNIYGGGIMYYDPGRQPIRHGVQPPRRAKAAIPIVAPDGEIDSYMVAGRPSHHD